MQFVIRALAAAGEAPGPARAMAVDYQKVAAEVERIQPVLREWAGY